MTSRFRQPEEMAKKEPRTPLSARVKVTTKEALDRAAKKAGLSLGELVAGVLDDYAAWMRDQKDRA